MKKANNTRLNELEEYINDMKKENEKTFFVNEEILIIKRNNVLNAFKNYFLNAWNLFDWISIILLIVCITTHIEDIRNHTEYKAKLHIHTMSFTVIVISLRILKVGRIVMPKFGTLVMVLYYLIADMIIWFLL